LYKSAVVPIIGGPIVRQCLIGACLIESISWAVWYVHVWYSCSREWTDTSVSWCHWWRNARRRHVFASCCLTQLTYARYCTSSQSYHGINGYLLLHVDNST